MNVNTYDATSVFDERISIPKRVKNRNRVFTDEHYDPASGSFIRSWLWFETKPDLFQLGTSWETARGYHVTQSEIIDSWGKLTDRTADYPRP